MGQRRETGARAREVNVMLKTNAPSRPIRRRVEGRCAWVPGAYSGIGWAIALAHGRAGAAFGGNNGESQKAADEVVDEIERDGGRAVAL